MLGVRLDAELEHDLDALARAQRRSKSDIARDAIRRYLDREGMAAEAREQSLTVAGSTAEADHAAFLMALPDVAGWR